MRDEWGTDEQGIARVLDGLRRAEPLPGMEARVLERVLAERRSDAALEGTGRRWKFSLRMDVAPRWKSGPAWAVAGMAGVLLLGSGFLWRMTRTSASGNSLPHVRRNTSAPFDDSKMRNETQQQLFATPSGTKTELVVRTPTHTNDRKRVVASEVALDQQKSFLARSEAVESFPAPPMPLTRQERLLLRLLEGGEKGELVATLAPGHEDALRQKELQEFSTFFRPASPSEAEPPPRDTGLDQATPTDLPQ